MHESLSSILGAYGASVRVSGSQMSFGLEIKVGFVYGNESGESRLVVSIEHRQVRPVAVWRTSNPHLPTGARSQGSMNVTSFRRWATWMRSATAADWRAFEEVEKSRAWRREDRSAIRRIKNSAHP